MATGRGRRASEIAEGNEQDFRRDDAGVVRGDPPLQSPQGWGRGELSCGEPGNNCQGGDGGGFGAKNCGAERGDAPAGGVEEVEFGVAPAAFGTDGKGRPPGD